MNTLFYKFKRSLAVLLLLPLVLTSLIQAQAEEARDVGSIIYQLSTDTKIQTLSPGLTGNGESVLLSPNLNASGNPTFTIVEHPGGGNSIELSNRQENWYALDITRTALQMNGSNTYEITISGRILGGAFSGMMTIGGADSPWNALASERIQEDGSFEVTLIADPSIINQPQVVNAFRIQFNDNLSDFIVDEITVALTEVGDGAPVDLFAGIDLTLPSLMEVWADYFLMGNIYTPQFPNDRRGELLTHHFNVITAENIMKPDAMQPARAVFPFLNEGSDQQRMMDFAVEHDLKVVGHTLIWHSQSFPWFEALDPSPDEALTIMEEHIRTVMTYYKESFPGSVIAWDVVNEAIDPRMGQDPQDWRTHLRDTKWLRTMGPDYIAHAFHIAHEIDPDAILYYNDYNCNDPFKSTIIAAMVQELREDGVPIHRIGMQGHYNMQTPMESVRSSIDRFRAITGDPSLPPIGISFTEIDITFAGIAPGEDMPEALQIRQGQMYAQLMQIARDNADIIHRMTFWGMADADSWRADQFPNLFNRDLSAKPAFFAVADPDGFLRQHPLAGAPEPHMAYAVAGGSIIGTFNRDDFAAAERIEVANQMTAHNGATANVWVMWYDGALFLLAEVSDSTYSTSAEAAHEQDSLEIFISNENTRTYAYQAGDFQLRFNRDGVHTFGSTGSIEGLEYAVQDNGDTYLVEARIPLEGVVEEGRILGFDLQVNDAWGTPAARQAFTKWNDHTDNTWQSTEFFGELTLLAAAVDSPAPIVEDSVQETESSCNTLCVLLIVFGSLALIAIVVIAVVLRKKTKNNTNEEIQS